MASPPKSRSARKSREGPHVLSDDVIRNVFDHLDHDKNGVLEPDDVKKALQLLHVKSSHRALHEFVTKLDQNHDNKISYAEFASFVMLHHDALYRVWQTFQSGKDTAPSRPALQRALAKLDVHLTDAQTRRLHNHIVNAKSHEFTEFCSMLMLLPSNNSTQLLMNWLDRTTFDTGDEIHIAQTESYPAWKLLTAGGIAGLVSRTTTAPMDRLKVLLQASTGPRAGGFSGMIREFRNVLREGGWTGFWRGNGVNCVKIMPETALKFWVYENVKLALCDDPDEITVPERFVAGATGGAVAQFGIYPLEMAKTRLALSSTGQYKGIADCLVQLLREGGIRSWYRGLLASVSGIVPYSGVDLTVYSFLRDMYSRRYPDENPGVLIPLGCGAVATTCGQLVAYPLQLVRTRLQAQGMTGRPVMYSGILDCFVKTVKTDGVRGLYRGLLPNFMKALPAISISYAVYETVKDRL